MSLDAYRAGIYCVRDAPWGPVSLPGGSLPCAVTLPHGFSSGREFCPIPGPTCQVLDSLGTLPECQPTIWGQRDSSLFLSVLPPGLGILIHVLQRALWRLGIGMLSYFLLNEELSAGEDYITGTNCPHINPST